MSLRESFSVSVLLSQLTQRHAVQRMSASTGDPQICVVCIVFFCNSWIVLWKQLRISQNEHFLVKAYLDYY